MLNPVANLCLYDLDWGEEIELPNSRPLRATPHLIGGRYPCRSVGYIPRAIFQEYLDRTGKYDFNVLDPFMGSGTTAIEAAQFTKNIYGVEIDPYARLIASVSNLKYTKNEVNEIRIALKEIVDGFGLVSPNLKLQPNLRNIDYWFQEEEFLDLLKLKTQIAESCATNRKIENFFMVAFADIIRGCSKAERQSLKPYISTRFEKKPKN